MKNLSGDNNVLDPLQILEILKYTTKYIQRRNLMSVKSVHNPSNGLAI